MTLPPPGNSLAPPGTGFAPLEQIQATPMSINTLKLVKNSVFLLISRGAREFPPSGNSLAPPGTNPGDAHVYKSFEISKKTLFFY